MVSAGCAGYSFGHLCVLSGCAGNFFGHLWSCAESDACPTGQALCVTKMFVKSSSVINIVRSSSDVILAVNYSYYASWMSSSQLCVVILPLDVNSQQYHLPKCPQLKLPLDKDHTQVHPWFGYLLSCLPWSAAQQSAKYLSSRMLHFLLRSGCLSHRVPPTSVSLRW